MIKLNRIQKRKILYCFFSNRFELVDTFETDDEKYIISQNMYLNINEDIEHFINTNARVEVYFIDTKNYVCDLLIWYPSQKFKLKNILLHS